jgi:hypothetical protein
MGWKTIYSITQKDFQNMYNAGQYNWGDHSIFSMTYSGQTIWGAGKWSQQSSPLMLSPRLPHKPGFKTRITIKFFAIWETDVTGEVDVGVIFFKDGDTCKTPEGKDYFYGYGRVEATSHPDYGAFHTVVVEQENNTITITIDGKDPLTRSLEPPLNTVVVATRFLDVVAPTPDVYIGYLITDVTIEYYDIWEDIMNQITSMMNMMIWIMIAVVGISLFMRLFKKE